MKAPIKSIFALGLLSLMPLAPVASAQESEVDSSSEVREIPLLAPEKLDELLGPIALYPDAIIALILPASTAPTDLVLAARYLNDGGDPNRVDEQPWDQSVAALARFPDVVAMLDKDLSWAIIVGDAFVAQPVDVMQSIQRLRAQARAAGTLIDTPEQKVVVQDETISIVPAQPEVIYVPVYDPEVVYVSRPWYAAYPVVSFSTCYRTGFWLSYNCDWNAGGIWYATPYWRASWYSSYGWCKPFRYSNVHHSNRHHWNEWRPHHGYRGRYHDSNRGRHGGAVVVDRNGSRSRSDWARNDGRSVNRSGGDRDNRTSGDRNRGNDRNRDGDRTGGYNREGRGGGSTLPALVGNDFSRNAAPRERAQRPDRPRPATPPAVVSKPAVSRNQTTVRSGDPVRVRQGQFDAGQRRTSVVRQRENAGQRPPRIQAPSSRSSVRMNGPVVARNNPNSPGGSRAVVTPSSGGGEQNRVVRQSPAPSQSSPRASASRGKSGSNSGGGRANRGDGGRPSGSRRSSE